MEDRYRQLTVLGKQFLPLPKVFKQPHLEMSERC
ncbi:hypothetical protein HDEF_0154 [Candidatus Hamiltonella defensa 5AT (Acyrthosiphon pisum)]|uniref:Uncharacterized protein n=1 Tax=Hamiltonella defensa subsp. Acyrthosiphon pisum (strain 5AT) TaxID=572265 RepID=C4K8U0_HAMD5|nr:hypothetical protein HDEF_0154 [Candidatus Hamiltonella defensa 5AT (Acyrthosiphon pisum)]